MVQEIFRFLKNPRKPAILAMSRPDAKKNITTLVKAFGEDPTLRELANLVLIMVSITPVGILFIRGTLQPYQCGGTLESCIGPCTRACI